MASSLDPRSIHQRSTGPHRAGVARLRPLPSVPAEQLFGPQHAAIQALIGAASRIGEDQDRAIEREWYQHRGTGRFASRGAASQVASTAGRLDAQIHARQQAWAAADLACRDAVGDAAHALAVRDLICDDFTQEQYDALVEPWAAVMGPVHPDDQPLEASDPE